MSRLEIPDALYRSIEVQEIAFGIRQGLWIDEARRRAAAMMRNCYVARTTALQCEFEADYADYIEDMSLGGDTYKVPR